MNIITDATPAPNTNYFIRQSQKFDGILNVFWFGAIGDGLNDDTNAIQSALNFISKTDDPNPSEESWYGGGTVFLPKGVYLISETLFIGQNCRLVGVNNRYHFEYLSNPDAGGSVIKANFEDINQWVISSATYEYNTSSPPILNLLPYDVALSKDNGNGYNYNNYIYRKGINIENLTIDGGYKIAFGGIRLSNAGNSTIRNVGMHNAKCGFMLNTCWGGSIENCFVNTIWYGALVISCNSAIIIDSYFRGVSETPFIDEEDLPDFIYHDLPYSDWDLNDNVKYGKTGIYCYYTSSLSVISSVVEATTNAVSCLDSTMSLISIHIEDIKYYGIIVGIGLSTQLNADQIFFWKLQSGFYFGKSAMASLNTIKVTGPTESDNQLFVYNNSTNRNVTFSNTIYIKRKYFSDILFADEGVSGQNYGAVYVNPDDGNDDNYGFNQNDAIKTFDAALIRIQNQSTVNPIKTIYVRAAPMINEEGNPKTGAAIKNLDIVSIENADVLITTYDINLEVNPPRIKGRIFFEGLTSKIAQIGQIEFLGNVNMYFRNVDLVCNNPNSMSANQVNLSMFGLRNSYGRLSFNNDSIYSPPYDIDLNLCYSIIQANINTSIFFSPLSLIDIKFANITINGGCLSPVQNGTQSLGVDCVQIGSSTNGVGWQDASIIRNNL